MDVRHMSCGRLLGDVAEGDGEHGFFIDFDAYLGLRDWVYDDNERTRDALETAELDEFLAGGGDPSESPGLQFLIAELQSHSARSRRKPVMRNQGWTIAEAQLESQGNEAVLLGRAWGRRRREWPKIDERLSHVAEPVIETGPGLRVHNGEYDLLPMPFDASVGPLSYCECVKQPVRISGSDLLLGLANRKASVKVTAEATQAL